MNRPAKITESKDQHLSLAGSFGDLAIVGLLKDLALHRVRDLVFLVYL